MECIVILRFGWTQSGAELLGCFSKSIQDLFLPGYLNGFIPQYGAGLAIERVEAQHVFGSKAGDGTKQHQGASGALAQLQRGAGVEMGVAGPHHEL